MGVKRGLEASYGLNGLAEALGKYDNFNDYDKRVQKYMKALFMALIQEYGEIKDEWELSMLMIADTYELYCLGKDTVKKDGLFVLDGLKRVQRNPGATTMLNASAYLQKLTNAFGLTINSKTKIKSSKGAVKTADDDDFIKKFVGE